MDISQKNNFEDEVQSLSPMSSVELYEEELVQFNAECNEVLRQFSTLLIPYGVELDKRLFGLQHSVRQTEEYHKQKLKEVEAENDELRSMLREKDQDLIRMEEGYTRKLRQVTKEQLKSQLIERERQEKDRLSIRTLEAQIQDLKRENDSLKEQHTYAQQSYSKKLEQQISEIKYLNEKIQQKQMEFEKALQLEKVSVKSLKTKLDEQRLEKEKLKHNLLLVQKQLESCHSKFKLQLEQELVDLKATHALEKSEILRKHAIERQKFEEFRRNIEEQYKQDIQLVQSLRQKLSEMNNQKEHTTIRKKVTSFKNLKKVLTVKKGSPSTPTHEQ